MANGDKDFTRILLKQIIIQSSNLWFAINSGPTINIRHLKQKRPKTAVSKS